MMPNLNPNLPTSQLNTLEQLKFDVDPNNPESVIVKTYSRGGIYKQSGLSTGGEMTEVSVSTSWVALPATPLANRNAISIQNQGSYDVKLNYNNATVGYVGVIIPSGGERHYMITDAVVLYARCETNTTTLLVEEIA